MSEILVGVLQPGARALGVGVMGARRGVAMFSGVPRGVIVKPCTAEELSAECFCVLLAHALSVSAPPCGVVYEGGTPLFASVDQQAPNLMQQFCLDPENPNQAELQALVNELVQWIGFGRLIALDILMLNADRHPGNLLSDGLDFWAIDHARSLGLYAYQGHKAYRLVTAFADSLTCANIEAGAVSNALTFPPDCELPAAHELSQHAEVARFAQPFAQLISSRRPSLASSIKGLL